MNPEDRQADALAERLARLPGTLQPPGGLEDRVVAELRGRGLLPARRARVRPGLAVAATLAAFALGALAGWLAAPLGGSFSNPEGGLYALLLYETPGYLPPRGEELTVRYREYSTWVAEARRRGQFVTGEDLEVAQAWRLAPAAGEVMVTSGVAADQPAPLSGLFLVRADAPEQALELARALPHLRHGGQVIVQRTIPTDTPPAAPGS